MVERVAEVIGGLRDGMDKPTDALSSSEDMIGKIQDLVMRRHRAYLREIEAEIYDQIDQLIECSTEKPEKAGLARNSF